MITKETVVALRETEDPGLIIELCESWLEQHEYLDRQYQLGFAAGHECCANTLTKTREALKKLLRSACNARECLALMGDDPERYRSVSRFHVKVLDEVINDPLIQEVMGKK